jgi:hypothetical protein
VSCRTWPACSSCARPSPVTLWLRDIVSCMMSHGNAVEVQERVDDEDTQQHQVQCKKLALTRPTTGRQQVPSACACQAQPQYRWTCEQHAHRRAGWWT